MLKALFVMGILFALSFSVTTVLLLVRERILPTLYWHEEDDLLER